MENRFYETDEKYLKNCIKYVKGFLKEACGDESNTDFFKTFNFGYLLTKNGVRKYGQVEIENEEKSVNFCESFNGDEDGTFLARLIYVLLWGGFLPNLKHAHTSFDAGDDKYGGDTINPVRDSIYYLTIGNFMVLPKGKVPYGEDKTTLNKYRGVGSGLNDDFYEFVSIIKKMDKKEEIQDSIWKELYVNNSFYFGDIDFSKFEEINMLEGWEALKDGRIYIEEFIKKRNERICKKLKDILKNR